MQSVTVNDTVSRVRKEADIETADQTKSVCPDAELIEYINHGYRALYDIIVELAGPEYFGKSTTLTSPYALPSDFYQLIAVDYGTLPLRQFAFAQRHIPYDTASPRFRVQAGSLVFNPSTFAGSVTLWYVPHAATLSAGGSFDSYDGWDTYVIAYAVLKVRQKQEYDTRDAERNLAMAEARVRRNAARIKPEPGRMHDVRSLPDEFYYG